MRTVIFNCVSRKCVPLCFLDRTVLVFRQELPLPCPEVDLPACPPPLPFCTHWGLLHKPDCLPAPGFWELTFSFLQTAVYLPILHASAK